MHCLNWPGWNLNNFPVIGGMRRTLLLVQDLKVEKIVEKSTINEHLASCCVTYRILYNVCMKWWIVLDSSILVHVLKLFDFIYFLVRLLWATTKFFWECNLSCDNLASSSWCKQCFLLAQHGVDATLEPFFSHTKQIGGREFPACRLSPPTTHFKALTSLLLHLL